MDRMNPVEHMMKGKENLCCNEKTDVAARGDALMICPRLQLSERQQRE